MFSMTTTQATDCLTDQVPQTPQPTQAQEAPPAPSPADASRCLMSIHGPARTAVKYGASYRNKHAPAAKQLQQQQRQR